MTSHKEMLAWHRATIRKTLKELAKLCPGAFDAEGNPKPATAYPRPKRTVNTD
jgi:hypothetical protein